MSAQHPAASHQPLPEPPPSPGTPSSDIPPNLPPDPGPDVPPGTPPVPGPDLPPQPRGALHRRPLATTM